MAIKIVVSNKVKFKVKGVIRDENGIDQPFDFSLLCTRLDADQITSKLKSDTSDSIVDFMADVVEDWTGVKDAEDAALPYNEATFRQLCKLPGVAGVAFRAYMQEVGAREKN